MGMKKLKKHWGGFCPHSTVGDKYFPSLSVQPKP